MINDKNKIFDENEEIASVNNEKNNLEYDVILEKLQKNFEDETNKLNTIIQDQEKNIIYLKADIENIKRNSFKEVQNSVNRQVTKVIDSFLLVFDDYERSIEYAKKNNDKDILEGLLMTYNSFLKVLKDLEVIEIDTNNFFDPNLHEAIGTISDPLKTQNTISEVIQKGFTYKKQLLRPARVIIVS
jgi:molecular chaperone GrpE